MKKCLLVVYSYHHNNTLKIAEAIAKELDAEIKAPDQINVNELSEYDLIGFGSGIDSAKHYKELLDFASSIEVCEGKKSFIFSTAAMLNEKKTHNDHRALRDILHSKSYKVLGEFSCKGYNTNSFLKFFGGMNRKHPTSLDIENTKNFAKTLLDLV